MIKLTVAYSGPSSETGNALYKALKESNKFKWVKHTFNREYDPSTEALIRWGDSSEYNVRHGTLIVNTKEAVRNASDKYKMMSILRNTGGVRAPKSLLLDDNVDPEILETFRREGHFYVRGSDNRVRYDSDYNSDDLYITCPIERKHEYRVQVFNGSIIGIYEKMPENESQKLMKDYNCHFRKLDPSICTCKEKGQEMAINAVKAIGLISGGVDVIKDIDNYYYINEVNSGFGLNSINIEKFRDLFTEYIYDR